MSIKEIITSEGKYTKPIIGSKITIKSDANFFDKPGTLANTVPYLNNQTTFKCIGHCVMSALYTNTYNWYCLDLGGGDSRWVADYDVISGGGKLALCLLVRNALHHFFNRKVVALCQ